MHHKKGRNRVGIQFNKFKWANELINHEIKIKYNWKVNIPVNLSTVKGIVRGIDNQVSMEVIIK